MKKSSYKYIFIMEQYFLLRIVLLPNLTIFKPNMRHSRDKQELSMKIFVLNATQNILSL